MSADLQPDTGEVLQEEAPHGYQAIPVCVSEVKTPVRVQPLPRKGASTRTRTVTDTKAVQVLEANPRRYSASLMSMDQEMLVAFSQAACQDPSTMAVWPKAVPFPITATVDVYVQCATTSQTTRVAIVTELWAEG